MPPDQRFVFDTNILVSALLFQQGKPSQAFHRALAQGRILTSLPALEELSDVLRRKKFDRYLRLEERDAFLRAFLERADLVEPTEDIRACRDPKDDKFLELAVSGGGRYIVTGDPDLLVLNPFRDIAIVTANQFLALSAS